MTGLNRMNELKVGTYFCSKCLKTVVPCFVIVTGEQRNEHGETPLLRLGGSAQRAPSRAEPAEPFCQGKHYYSLQDLFPWSTEPVHLQGKHIHACLKPKDFHFLYVCAHSLFLTHIIRSIAATATAPLCPRSLLSSGTPRRDAASASKR